MSAALHHPRSFGPVPDVTQAEIIAFHEAHFSHAASKLFETQFLPHSGNAAHDVHDGIWCEEEWEDEYDDGLGYYSDGVKRTLTDEQIAMFRHSELEALRRVDAKVSKHKADSAALLQEAQEDDAAMQFASEPKTKSEGDARADEDAGEASEDGEIETVRPQPTKAQTKKRKNKRKQNTKKFYPEKKPDLRKRTWDIVEAGMDSLDYDELDAPRGNSANSVAQRRQISYDD